MILWKPVLGLESRYEISNTGLVRSLRNERGIREVPIYYHSVLIQKVMWLSGFMLGEEVEVYNLNQFCKDNNLTMSNMSYVYSGTRKQHKGWTKCHIS